MPNYCECFLKIYPGDNSSADEILSAMANGERQFDFDKLIPYPEDWRKADDAHQKWLDGYATFARGDVVARVQYEKENPRPDDGYNHGGYEWCVENWGTKWNAGDVNIIEKEEYTALVSFRTAWRPPLPVMDKLAAMFPDACFLFEYYENGMGFCGSIRYESGKRELEARGEYYGFRGG